MTRNQQRRRRQGLGIVVLTAAVVVVAAAAASPPLPAGMDPAMRPRSSSSSSSSSSSGGGAGGGGGPSPDPTTPATATATGLGNGDAPNHPMDHDQPGPEEKPVADATRVVGPPASSPSSPQQQLVDLMRDGCFAPSDNLGDYNEYVLSFVSSPCRTASVLN
jgi:hypothetical protein